MMECCLNSVPLYPFVDFTRLMFCTFILSFSASLVSGFEE